MFVIQKTIELTIFQMAFEWEVHAKCSGVKNWRGRVVPHVETLIWFKSHHIWLLICCKLDYIIERISFLSTGTQGEIHRLLMIFATCYELSCVGVQLLNMNCRKFDVDKTSNKINVLISLTESTFKDLFVWGGMQARSLVPF